MPEPPKPRAEELISVAIGRWGVAAAPVKIRTLLGSCVGVVLYDRIGRLGGVAHVVLPNSRGSNEHIGKYADTAIPALLADLERLSRARNRGRITAKLVGGARMFQTVQGITIGDQNQEAVGRILSELNIPILARDLGGDTGRHLTLDTSTGVVSIRIPGGPDYEI